MSDSDKDQIKRAEADVARAKDDLQHAIEQLQKAQDELEEAEKELVTAEDHHHHQHDRLIHFLLDGEREETEQRTLTPNQIIADFGKKDPKSFYLARIEHGHTVESFKDRGDIEIKLHNGMSFQMIGLGPTPVSDGQSVVGIEAFMAGLTQSGYAPSLVAGTSDLVVFDYQVQSGRYEGQRVRLGFKVPQDFPVTPPSGPHVSPHIHPINPQSGPHPTFAVHAVQSEPFLAAGGEWQYWSRPFVDWGTSKKSVATYLSHIWRLWDSQ